MTNPGKQATKGRKQIIEENKATLKFYQYMALGVSVTYFLFIFFWLQLFTLKYTVLFVLCTGLYIFCYYFMKNFATPKYSETGALVDSGMDLNIEGGFVENIKDLIILTAGCQLLSLISNYFWSMWLLVPVRVGWLCWVHAIKPCMFQNPNLNLPNNVSDRKQRRLERRTKRTH